MRCVIGGTVGWFISLALIADALNNITVPCAVDIAWRGQGLDIRGAG